MANILIIKLGALGDVVMSTSLIKQIQSCHSTDNLFLLTAKPFDTIFHNWGNLNIHTVKRKGLKNSLLTIAWIRQNHFDSVYDLQSNDRTGLYCALSGISRRVGNHPRYPYNIHPEDSYQGQCHIYSRMLAVLESANIPVKPCAPSLPASEEEQQRIRTWLKENKLIVNNFIIIHAGGSKQHPEKRWPYYEQLATKLSSMDKTIVWIGGNDDLEINQRLSSIAGINASSVFTFSELAELGRHASFAIANDSGPMHVLSCSGVSVYGLFGPTNWRRNHAVGQEDRVISARTDGDSLINNSSFRPASLETISIDILLSRLSSDGAL
ncbi:MAG: ADP-heptose:LPS heptosyltransferase [Gammaproteobacteria bacterium]|jgi:ADP-heptose:LPS heptosyltransferase